MKNLTKVRLLVVVSLCLGIIIYAGTRSEMLFLNQFFSSVGGHYIRIFFHDVIGQIHIPYWIIYSLPDALWMLALMMTILMIWNFKLDAKSIPWIIGSVSIGLFFEFGQALHIITGTFDVTDLLFILIGASIPVLFTLVKFRLWKTN
ncbi:MAG: hypothetical protein WAT91_11650 [Saprospiraceae bacterium]